MTAFVGTAPISFLVLFVVYLLAIKAGVNLYMVNKNNGGALLILLGTLALMCTLLLALMTNGAPTLLSQDGYTFDQIVKMVARYSWAHIILQTIGIALIGLGFTNLHRYED
jgi:hypothetical protein